jgi:hypothetical protein
VWPKLQIEITKGTEEEEEKKGICILNVSSTRCHVLMCRNFSCINFKLHLCLGCLATQALLCKGK